MGQIEKEIESVILKYHSLGHFNGVAAASINSEPVLLRAVGHNNFETMLPLSIDTRFVIGSITKGITAAAILLLQQEGKLKIQDPVDKFLDYPLSRAAAIHNLLNHTAGLPFNPHGQEKPPAFGSFRYSNTGYIILGRIIEAVSGQTLDSFLQANIFRPLGLDQTGFPCSHREGLPTGYNKAQEEAFPSKLEHAFPVRGCGGLCSTARDLLKWDSLLRANHLLSQQSLELMFTPGLKNYGYGWYVGTRPARQWHTGTGAGFRSMLYREQRAENSFSLVLLSNYQNTPVEPLANSIRAVAFGAGI